MLKPSERRRLVGEWFGITERTMTDLREQRRRLDVAMPKAGQILLITGPSGAGKSTCLARLRRNLPREQRIDLGTVRLPRHRAVVDCFPNLSVEQTLRALARVGLGEATSYLLEPRHLSEGQKWRLKLALCIERSRTLPDIVPCLFCDEFAAMLDRITARVVARLLRRAVDEGRLRAVVATSHEDLADALAPDVVHTLDFGQSRTRFRSQPMPFGFRP